MPTPTVFTRLDIINAALLATGNTALVSEDDGSPEWDLLSAQWNTIVEAELLDGQYAHAFIEEEIASRAGDGRFGFDDRYTTPADALHVRSVWTENEAGQRTYQNAWQQDDNSISVNAPTGIWVEYVEVLNPNQFSALFAAGIQFKLEAVIYRALREEHAAANQRDSWAEEKLQRARTQSSRSKGPQPMFRRPSRFTDARFRHGR